MIPINFTPIHRASFQLHSVCWRRRHQVVAAGWEFRHFGAVRGPVGSGLTTMDCRWCLRTILEYLRGILGEIQINCINMFFVSN